MKIKRNKTKFISVRVKESEFNKIYTDAKKKKVSFSDYVRGVLLGGE